MDKSIEELRAQRELVKAHLDWLDRKLAEAEASKDGKAHGDGPNAPREQQSETAPDETLSTPTARTESTAAADPDHILSTSPTMDINRAKIGCLALFILSSTLFLFLLFGLPYLVN